MRRIREVVLPMAASDEHLPKTVREYRAKYKGVSRILDEHSEILEAAHEDLKKLSQGGRKARSGDFTSETLLRALIVHAIEGLSFRETVVRIAESEFLQDFLRTRKRAVMDHSFLDKCLQAVRPATWKRINELLGRQAAAHQTIATATIRTDTTVVETNIHWPTDSSLLWDTWQLEGETVPAVERVFSLFEPHTELIQRGRREKPVEFGHAVLLCQTPEKFITDYEVFEERPADCTLTEQVIERHEKLFGERPEVLANQGMT